jgi:hypothetical protein
MIEKDGKHCRVETNEHDVVVYDGTRAVLHSQIHWAIRKLRADGWKVTPVEDGTPIGRDDT